MSSGDGSDLLWLCRWFETQCDGEWERAHGVAIDTLDNPGWRLKVDVRDTPGLGVGLQTLEIEDVDERWLRVWYDADSSRFNAAGSPDTLDEMVATFRWAVEGASREPRPQTGDPLLAALGEWYADQCDGWWEHGYGVHATMGFGDDCVLQIELDGTPQEGAAAPRVANSRGSSASVDGTTYRATGSVQQFPEMLATFVDWAK